jgi:hypothetical protein
MRLDRRVHARDVQALCNGTKAFIDSFSFALHEAKEMRFCSWTRPARGYRAYSLKEAARAEEGPRT